VTAAAKTIRKPARRARAQVPPAPPAADLQHITPSLRVLAVPIASLKPDPRNARKHGQRNRASIRFSLEQFGQQRPISVDADGIILAGNGTYAEALAMGWKYMAAARSHLRGAAARAYAVADNRSAELAEWDLAELESTLDELDAEGFNVDGLEITDADLDKLTSDAQPAANGSGETGAGGTGGAGAGKNAGGDIFKTVVEHASEADQTAFLEKMIAEGRKCRALSA
jgi:ParB-like chromosome segregation protein Spo0J